MKKSILVITIIAVGFMFMPLATAMAAGDKNRGDIGQGETYEHGCADQPCFEDAPKPGSSATMIMESAGGTIDAVLVQDDAVEITVTFSDNCTRELSALTSSIAGAVVIQLFAGEPADPCVEGSVTVSQNVPVPQDAMYNIIVVLYDGTSLSDTIQLDSKTVPVLQDPDVNGDDDLDDDCLALCSDLKTECSDNCTLDEADCISACGEDAACEVACADTALECVDNCTIIFEDCTLACIVEARVDIRPETLNLQSKGRWVTAFITLPEIADENIASIVLEGIDADWFVIEAGTVVVKFDRQSVIDFIKSGDYDVPAYVELTITVTHDGGTVVEVSDTVRVINPVGEKFRNGKGQENNDDVDSEGEDDESDDDHDKNNGNGKNK